MDKNQLYNAQVDFFISTVYDLEAIHRNVRATGHNVVSDTRHACLVEDIHLSLQFEHKDK